MIKIYKSLKTTKNMKSQELKAIKIVPESLKKRVLLINPKRKNVEFSIPHNGLAILSTILRERGHEVLVVDYVLLHGDIPVSFFLRNFKPDIVGISSYSINFSEVSKTISEVNRFNKNLIILVGGPCATLYPKQLLENEKVDYVAVGEAELVIIDLVEKAKKLKKAERIQSREFVNLDDVPFPDFKSFYKSEYIRNYPIMTSRGCPFKCSFCTVFSVSNRKWRWRTPQNCIEELENAKKSLSSNIRVVVCYDCPTTNIDRFIQFLELYRKKIKLDLRIVNTRADCINDHLLALLKECGCPEVWLGVEHAHPEVYKLVNKGESLEKIKEAARLVKKYGLKLGLSFIIGLPEDNYERVKACIKFANETRADYCGWNLVLPYEDTEVGRWFKQNGVVGNTLNYDSRITESFTYDEPCAESPDFPQEERLKAYYRCIFRTPTYPCNLRNIGRAFQGAIKYNILYDFFYWLPRGFIMNMQNKKEKYEKILRFLRREGVISTIRRVLYNLQAK